MSATNINLYIDQNTDFSVSMQLFDIEDQPVNLEDYQFIGSIRKYGTSIKVMDWTISWDVSMPNTITLSLGASTSLGSEPGKYQYDVLMISPFGEQWKIINGLAFINDTVTRN